MLKKDLLKFMKTLNIEDLPDEFKNDETNKLCEKVLCIRKELLDGDMTKGEIKEYYDVDDYVIDYIIKQMYNDKDSKNGYIANSKLKKQRDITRDRDLELIVNEIIEYDNKKNVNSNLKERLKFAYNIYTNNLIDTFKDVVKDNYYIKLLENPLEFRLRNFANKELGLRERIFNNSDMNNSFKDCDWLNLFNINYYFAVKDGEATYHYQYIVNGKPKTIKLERVIEIMKILSDNNIPLIDCIVREAIIRDLYNELDTFINYFSDNKGITKSRRR